MGASGRIVISPRRSNRPQSHPARKVGFKEVSTGEPATTDTIYQLGSMSKTWTALAFRQLLDEGQVALDEPVRSYIPSFESPIPKPPPGSRRGTSTTPTGSRGLGQPGEGDDVYERMVEAIAGARQVFSARSHGKGLLTVLPAPADRRRDPR
jgi:hypothetical protein